MSLRLNKDAARSSEGTFKRSSGYLNDQELNVHLNSIYALTPLNTYKTFSLKTPLPESKCLAAAISSSLATLALLAGGVSMFVAYSFQMVFAFPLVGGPAVIALIAVALMLVVLLIHFSIHYYNQKVINVHNKNLLLQNPDLLKESRRSEVQTNESYC